MTSITAGSAGLPSMDSTLGVTLIGALLSMGLWGIGTAQVVYYYDYFPKDERIFKILVALSWIFTTAYMATYDYMTYFDTVKAFTNLEILFEYPTATKVLLIFGLIGAQVSQIFFAIRVIIFSNKNIFLGVYLGACILALFVLTLYQACIEMNITSITAYENISSGLFIGCLAVGAWADVSLAASLIFLLVKRGRGGMAGTWNVVRRVIFYALSTCSLCFALALTGMITRATLPNSNVWGLFAQLLNPVYLNSMLAALNSRTSTINNAQQSVMSGGAIRFASNQTPTADGSHLEMGSFSTGGKTFVNRAAIDVKGRDMFGEDEGGKVVHITREDV